MNKGKSVSLLVALITVITRNVVVSLPTIENELDTNDVKNPGVGDEAFHNDDTIIELSSDFGIDAVRRTLKNIQFEKEIENKKKKITKRSYDSSSEEDTMAKTDDIEEDEYNREGRKIVMRRKISPNNKYYVRKPFIRPPVNYVSNGRPFKVLVNDKQLLVSSTASPSTVTTTTTATTTTAPNNTTTEQGGPLTWLAGRFPFNGIPMNLFHFPAPMPISPVYWINSMKSFYHQLPSRQVLFG